MKDLAEKLCSDLLYAFQYRICQSHLEQVDMAVALWKKDERDHEDDTQDVCRT